MMKMKKLLLILLFFSIVISTLVFAFVYESELIVPEMELSCDYFLQKTKVGEERCCQIGWSYDNMEKYPLKRCIILQ